MKGELCRGVGQGEEELEFAPQHSSMPGGLRNKELRWLESLGFIGRRVPTRTVERTCSTARILASTQNEMGIYKDSEQDGGII